MILKTTKKEFFSGSAYQAIILLCGIIVLPISIHYLNKNEMGFWYVFLTFAAFAQLLEFGYQPTISRFLSAILSGTQTLNAEGWSSESISSINYQLLYDLIQASKRLYIGVSFLVFIVLSTVGTLYLFSFNEFTKSEMIAWCFFVLSISINFYYTYCNAIIIGRGNTVAVYKVTAISKVFYTIITVILLSFGFGLIAMAVALLASTALSRFLLYREINDDSWDVNIELNKIYRVKENIVPVLYKASWKLGVTGLGAFLIRQGNTFVAASFLSIGVAGSYGLTIQVFSLIRNLASMIFNLNLPKMNSLQVQGKKNELKNLFVSSILSSTLMYVIGAIISLLIGEQLIDFITNNTSGTKLLPTYLLAFVALIYLLEHIHSLCGIYLTTYNRVPFLWPSIISGGLIFISSIVACNNLAIGVMGLLIPQFIVQLCFNNWYWPYITYRDLIKGNEKFSIV
ncbi:hypothetical protein J3L11_18760 [Shewanella sp. 4t3-1-2LB]|uniref:O-unit flippase-like protein n=1 Tax=Shewanella sp. 4t3-1-2LB TaxID=2817682 RepID=UPI001A9A295F|nr:O-unit flippase-like protein [Shewanella sp. 4t3-1-2LB]MBO1273672.1 hypothetical protein [Shewanella sp. 4t3-1-2LB]